MRQNVNIMPNASWNSGGAAVPAQFVRSHGSIAFGGADVSPEALNGRQEARSGRRVVSSATAESRRRPAPAAGAHADWLVQPRHGRRVARTALSVGGAIGH